MPFVWPRLRTLPNPRMAHVVPPTVTQHAPEQTSDPALQPLANVALEKSVTVQAAFSRACHPYSQG
jgi:hypothetical protein